MPNFKILLIDVFSECCGFSCFHSDVLFFPESLMGVRATFFQEELIVLYVEHRHGPFDVE